MGIRGAFSLLCNDPHRFGTTWLLTGNEKNEEKSSCVFLDGPSLLYHVAIEGDVYDSSPPLTLAQIHQQGAAEQASPVKIHRRITNFLSALLQVCHGDVRVVMDGLAPEEKMSAQVDRLRVMAIQGDKHATKPKSPCKLLHLLAESAMVEALHDIAETQPRLFLHQPARGEAETFIDCWISKRHSHYDNVYIVSDDTDFLVYSSCPGFIPFKTLEFHLLDGCLSLNGFHYLRSKFINAFFSDLQDEHAMSAVAALTGCDYGMSDSLKRARTRMIQSDFGGLRPRLRNDPTSAAALTAILRYVSYWMKRKQDSWLSSMADVLCSDAMERRELLLSLERIHHIYFPNDTEQVVSVGDSMSVECRRLLECGVLYCRPLVETWESSNESASRSVPFSRKRARKSGKSRRRKRPIEHQDCLPRSLDAIDNPPRDTSVPFPPTQAFVDHCQSTGSAWSVFSQVRARLYSLIHQHCQVQQDNRPIRLHPSWRLQEPIVTEYIRVGRGGHVNFVPTSISVLPCSSTSISVLDDLLKCIVKTQDRVDVLKLSICHEWQIMMAALMLPAKSAFLLILLCKAPWHSSQPSMEQHEKLLPPLRECMTLISVALFHSSLLRNWLDVYSVDDDIETLGSATLAHGSAPVCRIFRDEVAIRIWVVMMRMNSFDDDSFQYETSTDLIGAFFDQLRVPRTETEALHWSESEVQEWHQETKKFWKIWCLV